jgi:POT family proton-dependent oligopeptide transporter
MSHAKNALPHQVRYIVGNEGCERFSFYGMRSILVIFMITNLGMDPNHSKAVYHLFMAGAYLMPLLGAWLADKVWGRYRAILYLSVVYCIGHAVMAMQESRWSLYTGLTLIAIGTGGIKPNVSAFVADQIPEEHANLRKKVFEIFYWMINFGAFFSTLLIPYVREKMGARIAFAIPGVLMGIATWIFWLGRKQYVMLPPERDKPTFGQVGWRALHEQTRHWVTRLRGTPDSRSRRGAFSLFDHARGHYPDEIVEGMDAAWGVMKLFVVVSVFWALFDQNGSSWVLQAKSMNLEVGPWGWKLQPDQIQAANPILVLALIPLFSKVIYPALQRMGWEPTPLRRMTVGMVVGGMSFAFVGLLQQRMDAGHVLSVNWQLIGYLLLTAGEVMLSITGLEFAYSQAPASMKSTLMSFWFLTTFFGNLLTAAVEQISTASAASKFYFFAFLMWAISALFAWMSTRYVARTARYSEPPKAAKTGTTST